jgi:hypothetical protein
MKISAITIRLDDKQRDAVQPMLDKANAAYDAGTPGMVLAQVFGPHAKVFFATHEQAQEIQRAMGSPVGMIAAYEGAKP